MSDIRQKDIFLASEGDAWFVRNRANLEGGATERPDPVALAVKELSVRPGEILEIGCANGWRLDLLTREYGARGCGIDPSAQAIADGRRRFSTLDLSCATAELLPFGEARFDLLIYGFCLYLCDRRDLFRIVAEGDRVLADGGHLLIYDFFTNVPHRRIYHHDPRLVSYKMDYAALFCANPNYRLIANRRFGVDGGAPTSEDDALSVAVLKKNISAGFPLREPNP